MVAGGFARRVWAIRLVTVRFIEGWRVLGEGTINFVGRNLEEAKIPLCIFIQGIPVTASGFQKTKGTDDIGLYKVFRTMNGTVDMAFRGKIDDGAGLVAPEQISNEGRVTDIAFYKNVPLIFCQCWRDSPDYPRS